MPLTVDGDWRRPSANTLVSAIFVEASRAGVEHLWVSQLIALAATAGIDERGVRTSLHRLEQQAFLRALRIGRQSVYGLTAAATADRAQRYPCAAAPPWNGRWTVVAPLLRQSSLAERLHGEGLRQLVRGLYARPGGCPASVAAIVRATGAAGRTLAFEAQGIPGLAQDELVAAVSIAWDLPSVARLYDALLASATHELKRFADPRALPDAPHSFAQRLRLMHQWRRARALDPQLPDALLPPGWPAARALRLCLRLDTLLDAGAQACIRDVCGSGKAKPPILLSRPRGHATGKAHTPR